jgi:hypothetical protein
MGFGLKYLAAVLFQMKVTTACSGAAGGTM